ncbi:MAG: carboxypeptidase-like regulatory domain-containing protein, partial [Bacteroidia bacterium]
MEKLMKLNRIIALLSFFVFQTFSGLSQNLIIRGVVLDEQTLKPLQGTSITLNKKFNALTDSNGFFSFRVEPGKHQLKVSRIGYRNFNQQFEELLDGKKEFQILLEPFVNQLGQVVVAGSRGAKVIAREVSSINVIQPYLIANTNSTDLSEVLNKVPG